MPMTKNKRRGENEYRRQYCAPHHRCTLSDGRQQRMVRVWTPGQSEHLRNLIEIYFPGAYRIDWVWVAAQMRNVFTRKQSKNKWEIMRRGVGIDDEKYLPERPRGGVSVAWDPLELREVEHHQKKQQHQQQRHKRIGSRIALGAHHCRCHSISSLRTFQRPGSSNESFIPLGVDADQGELFPCRNENTTSGVNVAGLSSSAFVRYITDKEISSLMPRDPMRRDGLPPTSRYMRQFNKKPTTVPILGVP